MTKYSITSDKTHAELIAAGIIDTNFLEINDAVGADDKPSLLWIDDKLVYIAPNANIADNYQYKLEQKELADKGEPSIYSGIY